MVFIKICFVINVIATIINLSCLVYVLLKNRNNKLDHDFTSEELNYMETDNLTFDEFLRKINEEGD